MKTNRYRVVDTVTECVLKEGSRAQCEDYLKGLALESPKVAPTCKVENYDDESGKWN